MSSAAMARSAGATAVVATRVGTRRDATRVVDVASFWSRRASSRRARLTTRLASSAARDAEAAAEDEDIVEKASPAALIVEDEPAVADPVAAEADPTMMDAGEPEPTPEPSQPASAEERQRTGDVEDLLSLTRDKPPMFFSPSASDLTLTPPDVDKPLMLYVPGLDGTGFAASTQFERLERSFDLKVMHVQPTDRSDFGTLVDTIATFLEEETARRADAGEKPRPGFNAKAKKKKFSRDA